MKKVISSLLLTTSLSFAVNIGVLGHMLDCPDKKLRYIFLDVEDHNNRSGFDGDGKPYEGAYVTEGKVLFVYCKISSTQLQPVPYDYVVLRMDYECPSGSYKFRRHHDTEDSHNNNGISDGLFPNVVGDNADLEYCFVPATAGAKNAFPIKNNKNYTIFANERSNTIAHSVMRVDDEDSDNNNSYYWYGQDKDLYFKNNIITRIKRIVNDKDHDTYYSFSWVMPSLNKSADYGAPVVANNMNDAKMSVAAEIKGFDRSSVSFELKSAGNAVVSITNVNGAVVSKIVKENLNPGIHQVEWHSGIVPNGRYVVTIEHNGKISGKNVILK